MRIIADFHLHSSYSRATSKDMNIEGLARGAKEKGLNLLGTGDFTHPLWLKELKSKLKPLGNGIYEYDDVYFILTTEVATYFKRNGKQKRVHHVIHAPSFEVVEQINERLSKFGDLKADGRPILSMSAAELVETIKQVDKNVFVYPAHCLIPQTKIITNPHAKNIEEIKVGDKVLTHLGRYRKVTQVFKRNYKGIIYHIIPWYLSLGIKVTPEHPFLAIKSYKKCKTTRGLCRPLCSSANSCKRKYFEKYKLTWIMAKDLEKGDIIVFPRLKQIKDKKFFVFTYKSKRYKIKIDTEFCRLLGYYLAEGYTNARDAIAFTFNPNEKEYIEDVKRLIKKKFGVEAKNGKGEGDIVFYSKLLRALFEKLCYFTKPYKAYNKALPDWALYLPLEKQAEILRGWFRGDKGYTSSFILANQMKLICIRLGIVPCIYIDTKLKHEKRGKHFIAERKIMARHDVYSFHYLVFFEDKFNLLSDKAFSRFKIRRNSRHGWIDENYVYLPIRKIKTEHYEGIVFNLEVEEDNSYVAECAAIHNCWTPWMSCLGSKSGFDSVDECYEDQVKHVYALETGLSSDPPMNWRVSSLDRFTLLSNSDSHSPWPWRLGREANVFELKKLSYKHLHEVIKKKDKKQFLYTIEVDPNYGKYHYTGHRACNVFMHPREALKINNICPVCGKKLTVGVMQRVEELADRPEGYKPKNAIPYKTLLPLYEIISFALNVKQLYSKKVLQIHDKLIKEIGNELKVLLEADKETIAKLSNEKIADAIIKVREGKVRFRPGYDGVYGQPIFNDEKIEALSSKQKSLADFKA